MTGAGERRPLRVALNLLFLGEAAGGVGRYARALPGALLEAEPRTEVVVMVSRGAPPDLRDEPWAGDVRWVHVPVPNAGARLALSQYALLPLLARAHRADVIHSPANAGPAITPGIASVVSLMDVIWLVAPEEWDEDPRARRTTLRQVRHSVRFADRVFAISATAAREIVGALAVGPAKIAVTPLGVEAPPAGPLDEAGVRARLSLGSDRVLLSVAQKRRYKNLHTLVEALPALPEDVVLVLPGAPTRYEQELRATADRLGVAGRVRFPAWLPEPELEALYAVADAFALPSVREGFGLPILEAMARGVPVACSERSALAEIAGDAALMFDPERQEDVTTAITRLLEDPALRRRLTEAGHRRAAQFTWRRTGEASLAGYRAAIASRRAPGAGTSARR